MLDEDIKHAIAITKTIDDDYTKMDEYSRIYQDVSENIKDYMPYLSGNFDSALVPTSSGDHILEAVLSGISNITAFDLNKLAKYFSNLKLGAIKSFSKTEYVYFMYENMLSPDIFSYFKQNLDDDTRTFWEELYKNCSLEEIKNNLFRNIGFKTNGFDLTGIDYAKYCVEHFANYLDHYYFIQDKLEKTNIKHIDANLLDLPNILKEKYDLINLTNIYEYINRDIFDNGANIYAKTIHELLPFLNKNGKMMITYLYRCAKEDIEKYRGKQTSYAYKYASIESHRCLRFAHDSIARITGNKTIMDKLYAFRNIQAINALSDLPLEYGFVKNVGIGQGTGSHDMALVYTKK